MRNKFLFVVLCLTLCAGVAQAGDSEWFDMENCAMCKNLVADPELLDHTVWETHVIASGMMTLTVVEPEYQAAMAAATKNMETVGNELMAGKQMEICNFCQSMGGIMMTGKAAVEEVETSGGKVMLITSNDAATVEKIHAHADRTMKELAHMEAHEHDHAK